MSNKHKSKLREQYQQLQQQIEKARKEMQDLSRKVVDEAASELFEACPEVHQIHWTQYTPHFNDGDACDFSIHDMHYVLKEDLDEFGEWDEMYDGSTITKSEDVQSAEDDLKEATIWEQDPHEWRVQKFGPVRAADAKDWLEKNPNAARYNQPYEVRVKPYPDTIAEAERRLAKKRASYERHKERGDVILTAVEEFTSFLRSLGDDVMEALYGDHVSVIIRQDGTIVEEYEHD